MPKRTFYTPKEDNILKKLYPNSHNACLAFFLKRSKASIKNRAYKLGLKKSEAFLERRETGRFRKGNVPFNKGLKQSTYMSKENIEKTKKGRFKKGDLPHNTKPIGYERIDKKDGYTYIKVEGKRKLVLKQRYIYSQKYGKIPPNHTICFKDGNKQNFDIDNLECVSREELMARNTIHRYPKNLQLTLKRIKKLQRQIYAKSK